jgi:drug/metabolite transporter (DMT)-like permease
MEIRSGKFDRRHVPFALSTCAADTGRACFVFLHLELILHKTDPRVVGLLCLLVTSVGWGLNWPVMKFLLREWPPLFARGTAGMSAAAIIALIAASAGQQLAVPRAQVGRLVAGSLINVFAWMGFTTLALRWLNAGQGALLVYTMPVWATLLAWPLGGTQPSARSIGGLALCIAGVGMLFGGGQLSLGPEKLPGILFALSAAFLFALGTIVLKPLPLPPLVAVAWQLVIGCAPMLAFGLLFEHPDFTALTAGGYAAMAYMTIVPMGVCYISWFAALRRLPPATASIATLLTPVIGVIAAALALGEPLGVREFIAMGLTLGGVAIALKRA